MGHLHSIRPHSELTRPWENLYPPSMAKRVDFQSHQSVVDLFLQSVASYGDSPAIECLGSHVSYREMDQVSRAIAAWLQACGLKHGARVALMMPSTPQYLACQLAVLRSGFTVVNVNPLYTTRELTHQLKDSGADAIVVMENFASSLQKALFSVKVSHVIVSAIGDLLPPFKGVIANWLNRHGKNKVAPWQIPYAKALKDVIQEGLHLKCRNAQLDPGGIAMLQYTGGTTGPAKGAMLTQHNVLAATLQGSTFFQPTLRKLPSNQRANVLVPLPLYHVFTIYVTLMCLANGACVTLVPNPRDIDGLVRTMRRKPFHLMTGLNTLYRALAEHSKIKAVDFSSYLAFIAGGAATQTSVAQQWHRTTGRWITEGWGMTETCGAGTCNLPDDVFNSGCIGVPFPGTDIAIRDDDGNTLDTGKTGEICITGPQVMAGYWGHPEETDEAFWPDEYFRTGDIGVFDANGLLKIVDRKKDMILVSGFNVYPSEIEEVLATHPGVAEVAAIGVPDDQTGEAVKVCIVKKDASLDVATLRSFCAQQLTNYKRPRHFAFVESLPKSPVGKILRRELKNLAHTAHAGSTTKD